MKKISLLLAISVCLLFSAASVSMAAAGFHIGLGYGQLSNELEVSGYGTDWVTLDTPVQTYILDFGYEFSDRLALNAQYRWGTTDLAEVYDGFAVLDQDNTMWRAEAEFKWPVGKNVRLGAVVGFVDYNTTSTLKIDSGFITGELEQKLSGAYIGPVLLYNPNDCWEFGAIYRWMINPDGELKASVDGVISGSEEIDTDDESCSSLELYAKAQINENWDVKTGYTYTWSDYSIEGTDIDVSNDTGGLWVLLEYKF